MLIEIILIVVSFLLLVRCADIFVNSAIDIAKALHISEVIIGASIVTIGTTLPELLVSSFSVYKGFSDMAISNGMGSVIFNAGIICSLTLILGNNRLDEEQRKTLKLPVGLYILSTIVILFNIYISNNPVFDYKIGLILLGIFSIYCVYISFSNKDETNSSNQETDINLLKSIIYLILCAVGLAISSNLLVDNSEKLARAIGISEEIIGMTILAVGTSLPELITAITAIKKNHNSLSFGNIVGANLFDITLVTGLPMIIKSYNYDDKSLIFMGLTLMCIIGSILFTNDRKYKILCGIFMILLYICYIYLNVKI